MFIPLRSSQTSSDLSWLFSALNLEMFERALSSTVRERTPQKGSFLAQCLRNRQHDLALNVSLCSTFVRFAGIGKRERAVDGNANHTRVEQAPEFGELRAI